MSFEFELSARVESWSAAEEIAADTSTSRFIPLVPGRRRRWFRELDPVVIVGWDQGQELASDNADLSDDLPSS